MTDVREVPVELTSIDGSPVLFYVEARDDGGEGEVGSSVIDGMRQVTEAISAVAGDVAAAVAKAAPQKFSVELGFEVKAESGGLVALLARGGGTASIKVTLEWEHQAPPAS